MHISFRISETDKSIFDKNASNLNLSNTAFFKKTCIDLSSKKEIQIKSVIHKLLRISSISSNNLNQIAKNMNTYSGIYSESDMLLLKEINDNLSLVAELQQNIITEL